MIEDRQEKSEVERAIDLLTRIGEQYKNYVTMVELPDGKIITKTSNQNWAVGTAQRFLTNMNEEFRHEIRMSHMRTE